MSRTISERLARLRRLHERLLREAAVLKEEIEALERELRRLGFKPRKEQPRPNAARNNEITVGDAAEKVLRRARRPMRLGQIMEAIERRGLYRTKSKSFRSTLATSLKRDGRFELVQRGVYRLVE